MNSSIRKFPLLMAYILYPVVMLFTKAYELSLPRIWIDVVWVLLGGVAIFVAISRLTVLRHRRFAWYVFPLIMAIAAVVGVKWGGGWLLGDVALVPYFMEIKPVIYLLVAWIWVQTFGRLRGNDFIYFGAVLGAIIIVDFLVRSVFLGSVSRPHGSGEINYDACLLLISLIMSLVGKAQVRRIWIWLVVVGLLFTFSRTALAAAVVIIFLYSTINFKAKLTLAVMAISFVIGSFILRDLPLDALSSMDRYWMWVSGIELFIESPSQLMFGFPVGVALPANIPKAMEWLWNSQSSGWGLDGIYPYNFHAFWLRFTITWGAAAIVLLLVVIVLILSRRTKRVQKALYMLVLVEGITMGLFYLSNVGVPLFLALFIQPTLCSKQRQASKGVMINGEVVTSAIPESGFTRNY